MLMTLIFTGDKLMECGFFFTKWKKKPAWAKIILNILVISFMLVTDLRTPTGLLSADSSPM